MSQSDLARAAKLGSGTISNIMSGNRNTGQDTLIAIARALKVPTETVFRAAGLLPPQTEDTETIAEINHILANMPEEEHIGFLEYLRMRERLIEDRENNEASKRNRQRPAPSTRS